MGFGGWGWGGGGEEGVGEGRGRWEVGERGEGIFMLVLSTTFSCHNREGTEES